MTIITILLAVFILYGIQSWFYRRKWKDALNVDVSFSDGAVNEGDISFFTETIINKKILPVTTLQVRFFVHRNLVFKENENTVVTDNNYRTDIFSIMPYEKIQRSIPFECKRRGFYMIEDIHLISYDLFFVKKSVMVKPLSASLYVYPKPVDLKYLDIPFQKMMGTILAKRNILEDPFEFRGIRQYQTYDSMKDINWKASAKTGEWMVNVHNSTSERMVTILLNLNSGSNWKHEDLFETSIRIAASYAERLISAGIPTKLVTNGIDIVNKNSTVILHGAGNSHIFAVKEALSRIDIKGDAKDFTPFIENEINGADNPFTLYILISEGQSQTLMEAYDRLCEMAPGSQWIAPMNRDMEFLPERCKNAEAFKWEVEDFE